MADGDTQPPPDDVLQQALALAAQLQGGQQYQPARDTTPTTRSWPSLLGGALAGAPPLPGATDAEKEWMGRKALGDFGTALMAQSGNLQGGTIFTALGRGLQAAQQGALGSEQFTAANLGAQQEYQQKQQELRIAALKEAIPLLTLQQQAKAAATARQIAAGGGTGTSIATGGNVGLNAAGDSATRKANEGGPPAPGTPGAATAQQVHDFWIAQGYTEPQVAGIMAGGPGSESDFISTASGDKGTSYGLYQHHGDRLTAMRTYFGLTGDQMPTADQQNQYAAFEISPKGPLAHVGVALHAAQTPAEAATIWTRDFGVPGDKTEILRRANGAGRFLGPYTAKDATPVPAATTAQTPPTKPPAGAQALPVPPTPPEGMLPSPIAPSAPASTVGGADGGVVIAGPPGVATVGSVLPPGPAVAGDVGAIARGMIGAGAAPTTLAAGPVLKGAETMAAGPAAPAGAQAVAVAQAQATNTPVEVPGGQGLWALPNGQLTSRAPAVGMPTTAPPTPPAPQATTQQPSPAPQQYPDIKGPGDVVFRHPGTFADYLQHEMPPLPASEDFNPNLSAEQRAAFAERQRGIDAQVQSMGTRPFAEQPKIGAEIAAARSQLATDIHTEAQAKAAAAAANITKFNQENTNKIQERYNAAAAAYQTAAGNEQTSGNKIKEIQAQAGATERTAALNPINTEAGAAAHRLDDLQVLKGFSNNLGDPTFLTSYKIGGRTLADIISSAGLGGQALQDKAGQAQAFRAAALSIVRDLRLGGAATGEPRSNQDLQFITDMVPSEMQSPATRNAITSYIEQVNQRRMEYAAEVGRLVTTPQYANNVGGAMLEARRGMPDIIQTVPKEIATGGGDIGKQRLQWFRDNVPSGTFYRAPNGRMQVWHGVPGEPDYQP